jgi:hypothetical protein
MADYIAARMAQVFIIAVLIMGFVAFVEDFVL